MKGDIYMGDKMRVLVLYNVGDVRYEMVDILEIIDM